MPRLGLSPRAARALSDSAAGGKAVREIAAATGARGAVPAPRAASMRREISRARVARAALDRCASVTRREQFMSLDVTRHDAPCTIPRLLRGTSRRPRVRAPAQHGAHRHASRPRRASARASASTAACPRPRCADRAHARRAGPDSVSVRRGSPRAGRAHRHDTPALFASSASARRSPPGKNEAVWPSSPMPSTTTSNGSGRRRAFARAAVASPASGVGASV